MSSRIFAVSDDLDWKKAYLAAILEKDSSRTLVLIEQARRKLTERLHELKGDNPSEGPEVEAIHDASYLLQALSSSLSYREEQTDTLVDRPRC